MDEALSIRRYEPADADRVLAVHEQAIRASPISLSDAPDDADLREIPERYLDAGGEFLVGTVEGEVVAIGGLQPRDGAAEIRRMRVHPDHQRRGYGERLLSELESRAAELGFDRVRLETNENLTAARRLYEQRGYELVASNPDGGETVRYRKAL